MVEPSNGPAAGYCLIWLLPFTGFYWFSGLYWFSGKRGGREGDKEREERCREREMREGCRERREGGRERRRREGEREREEGERNERERERDGGEERQTTSILFRRRPTAERSGKGSTRTNERTASPSPPPSLSLSPPKPVRPPFGLEKQPSSVAASLARSPLSLLLLLPIPILLSIRPPFTSSCPRERPPQAATASTAAALRCYVEGERGNERLSSLIVEE